MHVLCSSGGRQYRGRCRESAIFPANLRAIGLVASKPFSFSAWYTSLIQNRHLFIIYLCDFFPGSCSVQLNMQTDEIDFKWNGGNVIGSGRGCLAWPRALSLIHMLFTVSCLKNLRLAAVIHSTVRCCCCGLAGCLPNTYIKFLRTLKPVTVESNYVPCRTRKKNTIFHSFRVQLFIILCQINGATPTPCWRHAH